MEKKILKLVKAFEREKGKVVSFFNEIDTEQFDKKIYTEGQQWTVRQVLAHFVESEVSLRTLIAKVVEEDWPGVSEKFDLDEYNEKQVGQYEEFSTNLLIDKFSEERSETIKKVSGWTVADLAKEGRHPFLGVVQVGEMLKLMYLHHTIHMRDIRNALKAE